MHPRPAALALLAVLGVAATYDLLVLAGLVPLDHVMGGRFQSFTPRVYGLLAAGLLILAAFAAVTALRAELIGRRARSRVVRVGAWVTFGYLALNTAANLAAPTIAEKSLALLTLVGATFAWFVAGRDPQT